MQRTPQFAKLMCAEQGWPEPYIFYTISDHIYGKIRYGVRYGLSFKFLPPKNEHGAFFVQALFQIRK
jgi:hypothetical protein